MDAPLAAARSYAAEAHLTRAGEPVDPFDLARVVGLEIAETSELAGAFGFTAVTHDANGATNAVLRLSSTHSPTRRRWTVARAVGAVMFHRHHQMVETVLIDPNPDRTPAGVQLELFVAEYAGELLMPAEAFRASLGCGNVGQALLFDVPMSVVRPRALAIGAPVLAR